MSWGQQLDTVTFPAGQDLSSKQYHVGQLSTAGQLIVGTSVAVGVTLVMTGVIQDKSTAAGISTTLGVRGISKVVAGASSACEIAITFGLPLVCSSNGHAQPSGAAGQHICGYALANLSTGSALTVIPMLIQNGAAVSTA